ncbi:type II toxin-antitoxin system HicA family toxin [Lacimonas salitolerans]|uniref:Type II toxin-antitoxin system HicA family toxin n=1 Tax=Lacimonas salitolerans TaxID=1323750 RepID=A0ABW4EA17_9RHOB
MSAEAEETTGRESTACKKCKQCYFEAVNTKHRKTLAAVFAEPVSGTLEWAGIERLLLAAGVRLIEGRGSRVRFEKDGEVATFHRPHPAEEAKRYQVSDARDFLIRIGMTP